MKIELGINEVFEKVFAIDYPVSEYADCMVEDSHYYKAISKHILENSNLLDKERELRPDQIINYAAIKLVASSFGKDEQYFFVETDILDRKIENSLDKLSWEELSLAYNYFYPIREWKLKAEFKNGDDYFECGYERLKITTVRDMLHIIIMADLDLALGKVKLFLNYQTERRFFYDLIGDDSEDIESRIESILT